MNVAITGQIEGRPLPRKTRSSRQPRVKRPRGLRFEWLEDRRVLSCSGVVGDHDHSLDGDCIRESQGEGGFLYDSRGNARFFDAPYYAGSADGDTDPMSTDGSLVTATLEVNEDTVPLSEVPVLHSNPGAPNILYLDFDGEIIERTDWNLDFNNRPIHAAPFDVDNDFETWSETELAMIREVWLRVSEDFLPFNIDVTTEEPAEELLNKPRGAIRAMITTNFDSEALGGTGEKWHADVGGVAYTSSWLIPDQAPVWSFYNLLPRTAKGIAEATTHEFGHAFGLVHHGQGDGFGANEYYQGHGEGETSWAPIMGTGYSSNVTQWSRGDYVNASVEQDDLELITSSFNEINFREDDIWEGSDFARLIDVSAGVASSSGVITEAWDYDTFELQHPGGPVNLHIAPAEIGPNLDIMVTLFDGDEDEIKIFDPPDGVTVWLQTELEAGTYYLDIEGGRFIPDDGVEGYSDYGSVGAYTISGHVGVPPLTAIAGGEYGWQAGTRYRIEEGKNVSLDASLTYGPSEAIEFAWDLDGDGAFDDAEGVTPNVAWSDLLQSSPLFDSGTYDIQVRATDDQGNVAVGIATLLVDNRDPIIEPIDAMEVGRDRNTRFEVSASDVANDSLTYEWKVYSIDDSTEVELTLVDTGEDPIFEYTFEELGSFEVRVRVTDDEGDSSVQTISVTVLDLGFEPLQGDLNVDGIVDFADFLVLSQNFGRSNVEPSEGDITADGIVDFADFLILSQNYGRSA